MPWWPGRKSNVNDKYRILRTPSVVSMSQLRGLPTGGDVAALEANSGHLKLATEEEDRQNKKFMLGVIRASKAILRQKDKRRRPRGATKEQWKAARKLRLTRTKRGRIKKEN